MKMRDKKTKDKKKGQVEIKKKMFRGGSREDAEKIEE